MNKTKGRRANWCKPCFAAHEKANYEADAGRRNRIRSSNTERAMQNKDFVWKYLCDNPCIHCGEPDPVVLEFDHRDPDKKLYNVSEMSRASLSLDTVQREIEKCDVLCANCHRRKTAKQFGWHQKLHEWIEAKK